jgi:hypothetical protein
LVLRLDDRGTVARVQQRLQALGDNIQFAAAVALTKTAKLAEEDEQAEMRDVFDRPKPYTIRGTYTKPATKAKPQSEVGLKNGPTSSERGAGRYLRPEIFGGLRRLKGVEVALRNAGILPNGYYIVPGSAARMDAYGNISRGQINQILSYLRVQAGTAGYNRASSDKSRKGIERRLAKAASAQGSQYFVGAPGDGKLPLGIWQRVSFRAGSAIKPVMIFVNSAPVYDEGNFDFHFVAKRAVRKHFGREFAQALRKYGRPRR